MNTGLRTQKVHWGMDANEDFLLNFLASIPVCSSPAAQDARPVILLVTGKTSWHKTGAAQLLIPILSSKAHVNQFSSFTENPKVEELEQGLAFALTVSCDAIIAVGGGTVLDMAKLLNFFISSRVDCHTFPYHTPPKVTASFMPLLAVPTTAGTGSEATHFAVLYKDGIKHSIEAENLQPSHVLLNPGLTNSLPPYLTACAGFDALAQAIESYWAIGSTRESRKYSIEAMKEALLHLERAVLRPNPTSRSAMLKAAYLSGCAIDIAKTTAAHALSYTLTSRYGLPHGHAVAMFLPEVFRQNGNVLHDKIQDPRGANHLKNVMHELLQQLECRTIDEGAARLEALRLSIGLTNQWMDKYSLKLSDIYKLASSEANSSRLKNNPTRLNFLTPC